jgi:hypothetical protein
MAFKIGDSVAVKKGLLDPESGHYDMSDWQGRIVQDDNERENDRDEPLHCILWDSVTLRNLPEGFVLDAIFSEETYEYMYLYESDLVPTTARDTEEDAKIALEELEKFYFWAGIDESGERIFDLIRPLGINANK